MKVACRIVIIGLVFIAVALAPTTASAWAATRFINHGTLTDVWIIVCNDGHQTAQVGEPDFDYKGCVGHGGLVVSLPPEPDGTPKEFGVELLEVLSAPPPPSQFTVGSLVFPELITIADAFSLTRSDDPSVWANTSVLLNPVIDPSGFQGIAVFGLNENILDQATSEVPEPGTIALFAASLIGLGALQRKRRK